MYSFDWFDEPLSPEFTGLHVSSLSQERFLIEETMDQTGDMVAEATAEVEEDEDDGSLHVFFSQLTPWMEARKAALKAAIIKGYLR